MSLDGIEYVLIPKDVFEKSIGISVEPEKEVKVEVAEKRPLPLATDEQKKASIMVVDAIPVVKKAQGSTYGYAERLKNKQLTPEDVMVVRTNFDQMPETSEIAANDFKDKMRLLGSNAKYGFYGPGAERDLG